MNVMSLQDRERLHLLLLGALIGITLLAASFVSPERLTDSGAPNSATVTTFVTDADRE